MLSDEDRVRELARLAGISIAESEVAEVANRFSSLMLEMDRLKELDLSDVQPVVASTDRKNWNSPSTANLTTDTRAIPWHQRCWPMGSGWWAGASSITGPGES